MVSSYLSNPILLGLFLVVGLVLLVKGADWLVDGGGGVLLLVLYAGYLTYRLLTY